MRVVGPIIKDKGPSLYPWLSVYKLEDYKIGGSTNRKRPHHLPSQLYINIHILIHIPPFLSFKTGIQLLGYHHIHLQMVDSALLCYIFLPPKLTPIATPTLGANYIECMEREHLQAKYRPIMGVWRGQ